MEDKIAFPLLHTMAMLKMLNKLSYFYSLKINHEPVFNVMEYINLGKGSERAQTSQIHTKCELYL